jgi:hypothetical protein
MLATPVKACYSHEKYIHNYIQIVSYPERWRVRLYETAATPVSSAGRCQIRQKFLEDESG